ncbi:MAG: hypothetical protein FJ288_03660 [Planctomycetes bacterium]|nr:hypothetical protein [Planctomycetota bacterium]
MNPSRHQPSTVGGTSSNSGGVAFTRATEAAALAPEGRPGFLAGGFRGAELFETGLRLATAIAATKVAIKDVQVFSSLFRGDMEGARKAAEQLPFGLGEVVRELGQAADKAAALAAARMMGLEALTGPDYGKRTTRAQEESRQQWNRGLAAIEAAQKAIQRATMSAEEYARAEVAGMNLAAEHAQKLLDLKLRLIEADKQRKAWAEVQAKLSRGEGLIRQAQLEYARLTMSEEEFSRVEVESLGLAVHHAETLLALRKAIREETEKQRQAKADHEAEIEAYEMAIRASDERIRALEEARRYAEQFRTPEERAEAEIEEARRLLSEGLIEPETYRRAVQRALEDAAAAMPDVAARATVGVRGTFSALEAAGLGAGGVSDRIANATEKTAKNTERIAELARNLGVTYS